MHGEVYKVLTEADDNLSAGVCKLLVLTTQMEADHNGEPINDRVGRVIKLGEWILKMQSIDRDMLGILKDAKDAEDEVLEMLEHGFTHQDDWGLTWSEYYVFNAIVNRRVCNKIYANLAPKSEGSNMLLKAATASST